ncbi:LOW QUALITY PROTEIN: neuropeptide Y receptor type 1-like [Clytia hemisphaerica]
MQNILLNQSNGKRTFHLHLSNNYTTNLPSLFINTHLNVTHGNQTNNTSDADGCPVAPDEFEFTKIIIIVVCVISAIIGLSGNLTIVVVRIFKQIQRRNTTAYTFLICQLAIADFVFAFTIGFDINVYFQHGLWTFSVGSCRFIKLIQSASLTTTVGFLTVMAYERYCGISRPLQHHWSIKTAALITLALWLYIFLTFIPMVTALKVDNCGFCWENNHPSEEFRKGYTMFLFCTNYIAPLVSIIVFHTLIVYRMKKHLKKMHSQRHRASPSIKHKNKTPEQMTPKQRRASTASTFSMADDQLCGQEGSNCWVVLYHLLLEKLENSKKNNNNSRFSHANSARRSNVFRRLITRSKTNEDRKLVKMLLAVTLSFALMTLPTQIYYIWLDFKESQDDPSGEVTKVVEVFSSLVYLHCCVNCVIYSAMDKKFRADVEKTFRFIFNCKKKSSGSSRQTFQRVTMVSRLSRSSRYSSTTTTTTSTSKKSDDGLLKKKRLAVIEDEKAAEIFMFEKETVIM